MSDEISVMVLGLRGFPKVQGGVETHAQHLYTELSRLGCRVEVMVRDSYQPLDNPDVWEGIRFRRLWAPRRKNLEAIVHTFVGVLYAALRRPDILHIHAIGPALLTPLARALGLNVVVTHHGADYERQKWGRAARAVLHAGERFGMTFASRRIVISDSIRSLVRDKYARPSVVIPNGVDLPDKPLSATAPQRFTLTPKKYVLLVSRMVPEKRHLDLIQAFQKAGLEGWKLALVGSADHPDSYTVSVLDMAANTPGVVCTGFQSGLALRELYAHASLFVLPSSHEGLPIAMLEALSYGLPVLASDIPANKEIRIPGVRFFPLGDVDKLAQALRSHALHAAECEEPQPEAIQKHVAENYRWGAIAVKTRKVYADVVDHTAQDVLD